MKEFLLPIASFVIAMLAFFFSIRFNIANRRPHLIFTEEQITEDGRVKTGFYLRNIGLGPAFNISIPEKYVRSYNFLSSFNEIPRNISSNSHTLFSLTVGNHRFIEPNLTLIVTYEDHQGRVYQTTLSQMKHTFKRIRKRK